MSLNFPVLSRGFSGAIISSWWHTFLLRIDWLPGYDLRRR